MQPLKMAAQQLNNNWLWLTLMAWLKQLMAAWRFSANWGKWSSDSDSLAAANDLAAVVKAHASVTLLVKVCSHLQNTYMHHIRHW